MKYDLLIVGGGPAGLTAAIHARVRGKSALVISNEPTASPLCKAPRMANYPGLPDITGRELVERLVKQAKGLGAEFQQGRALSVMPMGKSVMVSVENDAVEGHEIAPGQAVPRYELFYWPAIILAVVIFVLVKFSPARKLHPICFIGLAALAGTVFQM